MMGVYIYKLWNTIGKHWLQKYDKKFGVDFFLCKYSDIKGLAIASIPIPKYYQDAIQAWINFVGSCSTESKCIWFFLGGEISLMMGVYIYKLNTFWGLVLK
jgi:hypothetical protein